MRCAMPQPCIGSSAIVLRIRRSNVPWTKSVGLLILAPLSHRQGILALLLSIVKGRFFGTQGVLVRTHRRSLSRAGGIPERSWKWQWLSSWAPTAIYSIVAWRRRTPRRQSRRRWMERGTPALRRSVFGLRAVDSCLYQVPPTAAHLENKKGGEAVPALGRCERLLKHPARAGHRPAPTVFVLSTFRRPEARPGSVYAPFPGTR